MWLLAGMTALLVARSLFPSESAAQGDGLPLVMLWLSLAVLGLLAGIGKRRLAIRFGPVDAAVALLVAWQCVAALHAVHSGSPRPAWNMLWEWVGLGMVFFLARQIIRDAGESRRAVVAAMIALAAGIRPMENEKWGGPARLCSRGSLPPIRRARCTPVGLNYPLGTPLRELLERRLKNPEPMATFAITNSLAAALAPWLVIGLGTPPLLASAAANDLLVLCLAPIGFCLFLTKSRSGYVAVVVGVVCLVAPAIVVSPAVAGSFGRPARRVAGDGGDGRQLRSIGGDDLAGLPRAVLAGHLEDDCRSADLWLWAGVISRTSTRSISCPRRSQSSPTRTISWKSGLPPARRHCWLLTSALGLFGLSAWKRRAAAQRCFRSASAKDRLKPWPAAGLRFALGGLIGGYVVVALIVVGQIVERPRPVRWQSRSDCRWPWPAWGCWSPGFARGQFSACPNGGRHRAAGRSPTTGGIGMPSISQSLWPLCWPSVPRRGMAEGGAAPRLPFRWAIAVGLLVACHETSHRPVLACQILPPVWPMSISIMAGRRRGTSGASGGRRSAFL